MVLYPLALVEKDIDQCFSRETVSSNIKILFSKLMSQGGKGGGGGGAS